MLLLLLACAKTPSPPDLRGQHATLAPRSPDEAVAIIEDALEAGLSGEVRANALLRLAELHEAQYRQELFAAFQVYEEEYDACFHAGVVDCGPTPFERGVGHGWLRGGMSRLDQLLAEHPDSARTAEAAYMRGYFLLELDEEDAALSAFAVFLTEHPDSVWAAEAWMHLAEDHYNHARFEEAAAAYEGVIRTEGDKALFAAYKLAWCHLNLGRNAEAIAGMQEVAAGAEDSAMKLSLRQEALRDLVTFYIVDEDPQGAVAYADTLPPEIRRWMLRRLGERLLDVRAWAESLAVWQQLNEAEPLHENAPRFAQRQVRCLWELGQREAAEALFRQMQVDYGPDSAWMSANEGSAHEAEDQLRRAFNRIR